MPTAGGITTAQVKYHYEDHDTDEVNETPPVQNTWYTAFDAEDVRLIWCSVTQSNDEVAPKNIEIRWTIDGNVYLTALALGSSATVVVYRGRAPSAGGTAGLLTAPPDLNAGYYVDKRGKAFKVEARMTEVPGTNQNLLCRCVRETLEET